MIAAAEVREWLGDIGLETPVIETMITRATALVGRELGGLYIGEPANRTEILDGGTQCILLDQTPTETSTMLVSTRADVFTAWEDLDDTLWSLDGYKLWSRSSFPWGASTVRVTYGVGWDIGTGPQELQEIVRQLVVQSAATTQDEGLKSETLGDYSYTRADVAATVGWDAVARRWRRMRV